MNKILFYARDPGAANVVTPVFRALSADQSIEATLYGKDFACARFQSADLPYRDLTADIPDITDEHIYNFLNEKRPDLIISGVGSNDMTDRMIWHAAAKLDIKTFAVLDQWLNYLQRFTRVPFGESVTIADCFIPDRIGVMDDLARSDMIALGFPSDRLEVVGQPYFETIANDMASLKENERQSFKGQLHIPPEHKIVVFASEPIVESYPDPSPLGYNQFTNLDACISALIANASQSGRKITLLIKLHPRNNAKLFASYEAQSSPELTIICEQKAPTHLVIGIADLVIGMSSMFLLESVIAGAPILSVQLGLSVADPFILSRLGYTCSITELHELSKALEKQLHSPEIVNAPVFTIMNPTERVVNVTKQMLESV